MEEVPYRNTKLLVKEFPKGTVLFRLVKRKNDDEIRGIPIGEDLRCISPNHNVFFYPNPFIAKQSLEMWCKNSKHMNVYILEHPIKVLWLLEPSKYSRITKNTKRNFIKRCSKIKKGCLPTKPTGMHAAFNPCLSDTMIKNYPDITGLINLSVGDATRIRKTLRSTPKHILKFMNTTMDAESRHPSIPELILHPLRERPQKDLLVYPDTKLDNAYSFYKCYCTDDTNKILKFMETLEYNPETFFYMMKK
jgi:hypothetical protein